MRSCSFYFIVSALLFAAAPISAQDTIGQVKALRQSLHNLKQGDPADQAQLTQLATTISRFLDPTVAATAWANELASQLKGLADAKLPSPKAEAVNGALSSLIDAIKAGEPPPPAPAAPAAPAGTPTAAPTVDVQVRSVNDTLAKLKPGEGPPKENLDPAELTQLAIEISDHLDPALAVVTWATDLTFVLTERKPNRGSDDLKKALAALPKTAPNLEEPVGPLLNIIQAWFGDLYYLRRAANGQLRIDPATGTGLRVCDATNEVRAACQGKKTCPLTPPQQNAAIPAIGGVSLCGENPVPHADNSVAGVAIEYECLTATKKDWDSIQNKWRAVVPQNTQMVMLRAGTTVTVRCEAVLDNP